MLRRYLVIITVLCTLASCEKAEDAIVLPPRGPASHGIVEMGSNYTKQVFYDFETGQFVTSDPRSWDLAFEASADGKHVFLNGGDQDVYVYNTQDTNIKGLTSMPTTLALSGSAGWLYDDPRWYATNTAVGAWWGSNGLSRNEVYLVRVSFLVGTVEQKAVYKLRIASCTESQYVIEWLPLAATSNPNTVTITKDSSQSFVYFSFAKGVVTPDPPKLNWDVVFTRCRDTIFDGTRSIPYIVNSVLLNPFNTTAAADSTHEFSTIDLNSALALTYTSNRRIIGYDWKSYNQTTGHYDVNRKKNYVIRTRKDQLYRLHFLDFYSSGGVKGTPSFEYLQLK